MSGISAQNVPAEMWMEIFEWLPSSADLHNVILTCKKFHNLAMRPLHRDVIWKTPSQVAHNMSVWNKHSTLPGVTRSLEVRVSPLPSTLYGYIIDHNGRQVFQNVPPGYALTDDFHQSVLAYRLNITLEFATPLLHARMLARMASFTQLESLTFSNVLLSDALLALIHSLPHLRTLALEFCVFPSLASCAPRDHSQLPITELTLINLRRRMIDPVGDGHYGMEENVRHILSLATAHNLRTLRVDATADVFTHVFLNQHLINHHGTSIYVLRARAIPQHLERLYVRRKRVYPDVVQIVSPGESQFPEGHLYRFLTCCPSLTTFSIFCPIPAHSAPRSDTLPALRCYAGPVECTHMFAGERPVEALALVKCDYSKDGMTPLPLFASPRAHLHMLSLDYKEWDDELMHAIPKMFPELRRLKITFENGGPCEDSVVRMGPEFLSALPHLHTVQIYQHSTPLPKTMFDPSYASLSEELKNLIIPWNRYCKALREVQLVACSTMRRGFEGGPWDMYPVKETVQDEEFVY